ncbi:MAG TPA: VOC family protein [Burkholderiaceae bacterium]
MTARISNLGYAVFGVSDLDAWQRFALDIVGLQAGRSIAGQSLALRMDDYEQRLLLTKTGEDDLVALGWEFDTEDQLETFVEQAKRGGTRLSAGSNELTDARRVTRLYACDDPNGFAHEYYVAAARAPMADAFRSRVLRGAFDAGRLGAGHAVTVAKNYKQSVDFYRNVLGLKVSDYIKGPIAGTDIFLDLTFFHAATGRHHSLATVEFPMPKKIHHFMVQATDMNDVGLAYDRCLNAGVPIMMGPGHHPNDQMFSFYCVTPSGFGMEFGWGGIVIDDDHWDVRTYSQPSDWGHRPPQATA